MSNEKMTMAYAVNQKKWSDVDKKLVWVITDLFLDSADAQRVQKEKTNFFSTSFKVTKEEVTPEAAAQGYRCGEKGQVTPIYESYYDYSNREYVKNKEATDREFRGRVVHESIIKQEEFEAGLDTGRQ